MTPDDIKGFLAREEGEALAESAREAGRLGPVLEIGTYCGKSAAYIAPAAAEADSILFTLDHHRGSEEHQPGEGYHDPELVDPVSGRFDTLPTLRRNLDAVGIEEKVVVLVGRSGRLASHWRTPLGMLFIDGGHSREAALIDYRGWSGHVLPGGILAIHDVFPDPEEGGRPPYEIWRLAVTSGQFEPIRRVGSLELLRRL